MLIVMNFVNFMMMMMMMMMLIGDFVVDVVGFMFYRISMKGNGVVEGNWSGIIIGGGERL